ASRRRDSSTGVQPVDEDGRRQLVPTGWRVFRTNYVKPEPGNRTRLHERRVGEGGRRNGPDSARVLRVLPRGPNPPIGSDSLIGVIFKRVGTEEMGDDLLIVVLE